MHKGRSKIYEKDGDYDDALDDFESLNPKNIKDIKNGKVGILNDGRVTLEIQKGKNKTKIRYSK